MKNILKNKPLAQYQTNFYYLKINKKNKLLLIF
jgi:hypothetical protein